MVELNGTKIHENLKGAFAGESQADRRHLWFAQKADIEGQPDSAALFRSVAEGFDEIADWFETLARAEKSHAGRFTQGLESIC